MITYDNRKKKCENEKTQCHYNREPQGTGNKMENQKWTNEKKSYLYFFHNNLHFVNKTCWIMMIMAFGILMLWYFDCKCAECFHMIKMIKMKGAAKNEGCKGRTWRPWVPQNYFIFGAWKSLGQHGSPWAPGILFSWHPWVPNLIWFYFYFADFAK